MFDWSSPFFPIFISIVLICSFTMAILSALSMRWIIKFRRIVVAQKHKTKLDLYNTENSTSFASQVYSTSQGET